VLGADFVTANAEPFGGLTFVEAIQIVGNKDGEKIGGHGGKLRGEGLNISTLHGRRSACAAPYVTPPLTTDKRLCAAL
jgi:hypothetical protein